MDAKKLKKLADHAVGSVKSAIDEKVREFTEAVDAVKGLPEMLSLTEADHAFVANAHTAYNGEVDVYLALGGMRFELGRIERAAQGDEYRAVVLLYKTKKK
jgi:hypothetical protein